MRIPGRRGLSTLDFVLMGLSLALLAVVLLPAYLKSTLSVEVTRCYATQRRLHAALDAYETDHRQRLPDMPQALELLLKNGYISELPVDPGDERRESSAHYGRTSAGAVCCWVHGSPWAQDVQPEREPKDRRFIGPPAPPPKPPSPRPPGVVIKKIPGFWR